MKGRVNDKAHLELILKAIDNVFEFTVNYHCCPVKVPDDYYKV